MFFFSRCIWKFIWRDIYACNTKKKRGERSRLQLCDDDDATNIKEKKGNKKNNKTHSHCQGRRSLNVVHIIIIASRLYVFVHREEMKICTSWLQKLNLNFRLFFQFSNQTQFDFFFLRTRKNSCSRSHKSSSDSTIWRSRLSLFLFHYRKENRRRTFSKCLNFLQKFNALFFRCASIE